MSSEFKWYGPEVIKKMEEATEVGLTACAMHVQEQARLLAPTITNRLRDSIIYKTKNYKSKMDTNAKSEDEIKTEVKENEVIIGTNVFYAHGVELGNPPHAIPNAFGSGKTVWHPGNPPKSFLRKALDTVSGQLNNIFNKEYNRIMK